MKTTRTFLGISFGLAIGLVGCLSSVFPNLDDDDGVAVSNVRSSSLIFAAAVGSPDGDAGVPLEASLSNASTSIGNAASGLDHALAIITDASVDAQVRIDQATPDLRAARAEVGDAGAAIDTAKNSGGTSAPNSVSLRNGMTLQYGPTLSLLQYSVIRPDSEPAASRDYRPRLQFVPTTIGFQFNARPSGNPWRIQKSDGKFYQLMSFGGIFLVSVDTKDASRGALSLGATLGFFDGLLSMGLGFDLYRGIPVRGANQQAAGATAYTGVLAWAFSPRGEVTPENVFFVVSLGLEPLVTALSNGGTK